MEDYGPNTVAVLARLAQLEALTHDQIEAFGLLSNSIFRESVESKPWERMAKAFRRSDRISLSQLTVEVVKTICSYSSWDSYVGDAAAHSGAVNMALEVIAFEVVADQLKPKHYRKALEPFTMATNLPPWWSEPGSRNLFFELLERDGNVLCAQASVSALR